ncbi:SLC13 family permease [Pararobbsia alpina]|uniref:Inner membrane protein YbiR n=1 Tax=Pararobbsia alpina TaxID=621374 RepID=A0A6S7AV36_9BURK|nr:SLC13 family permease [Pararobbsia alpina]CAB3778830.1 Inner membrane protein YbiR [Pararobbsia alpina]
MTSELRRADTPEIVAVVSPRVRLLAFVKREAVLVVLVVTLVLLQVFHAQPVAALAKMIDWDTMLTLTGLLVLTRVIDMSGAMNWAAHRLLHRVRTERGLALVLVLFAALMSTVLTNDVALFAVIPVVISLDKLVSIPMRRLVIVIALAVNAGSILTPFGNPQNLFLWGASGVSFAGFVATMAPLTAVLMIALAGLTALIFGDTRLDLPGEQADDGLDGRTLAIASVAFVLFIVLADAHHATIACALVLAGFGAWRRKAVLGIDWLLLAVFALMFMVLRTVAALPWVHGLLTGANLQDPLHAFMAGALISQVISNVPAAIMLESFSRHWQALAYGASVGGFGFCVGSLANLIAMRLAPVKGIFWRFHLLSVPFFVFALFTGGLLINWI